MHPPLLSNQSVEHDTTWPRQNLTAAVAVANRNQKRASESVLF